VQRATVANGFVGAPAERATVVLGGGVGAHREKRGNGIVCAPVERATVTNDYGGGAKLAKRGNGFVGEWATVANGFGVQRAKCRGYQSADEEEEVEPPRWRRVRTWRRARSRPGGGQSLTGIWILRASNVVAASAFAPLSGTPGTGTRTPTCIVCAGVWVGSLSLSSLSLFSRSLVLSFSCSLSLFSLSLFSLSLLSLCLSLSLSALSLLAASRRRLCLARQPFVL
jgi:hypothetical protein